MALNINLCKTNPFAIGNRKLESLVVRTRSALLEIGLSSKVQLRNSHKTSTNGQLACKAPKLIEEFPLNFGHKKISAFAPNNFGTATMF